MRRLTYLTSDDQPITPSDRCPWCREFALQEDITLPDRIPILWCACCEQVAGVAEVKCGVE